MRARHRQNPGQGSGAEHPLPKPIAAQENRCACRGGQQTLRKSRPGIDAQGCSKRSGCHHDVESRERQRDAVRHSARDEAQPRGQKLRQRRLHVRSKRTRFMSTIREVTSVVPAGNGVGCSCNSALMGSCTLSSVSSTHKSSHGFCPRPAQESGRTGGDPARAWVAERTVRAASTNNPRLWRRGRDSNPRYGYPYAAFRVRCFQPLSHLSGARHGPVSGRVGTGVLMKARARNKGAAARSAGVPVSG